MSKPRLMHPVCKPCWELKYCPYGPLVEHFPLYPESQSLSFIRRLHRYARKQLTGTGAKRENHLMRMIELYKYSDPSQWEWVNRYDTSELGCNVFGHVCPVFFMYEPFTETKEGRRTGRRIPREIMLKVIRRDGQICQLCQQPVKDNEVEFDHLIPFCRGGPVTAENLRLTCRQCNRKKRDSIKELLGHGEQKTRLWANTRLQRAGLDEKVRRRG